jgi:ribosomal protein S18 acetylase RimI-like enzyme
VRSARADDAPALEAFVKNTLSEVYLPASIALAQHDAPLALSDGTVTSLLATQNEAIVALCQLRFQRTPRCVTLPRPLEVARFVIDNEHYDSGAADELFIYALHAGWEREARSLWLRVWEHDLRAMAFFERHRFRFAGQQDAPYLQQGRHDWIMTRTINV